LANDDWPVIDLTLRQFGRQTLDDWRGGKDAYVMEMIEQAPDDLLVTLAAHLGYESHVRGPIVEPSFWQQGAFRLFITHLASEREIATAIQDQLGTYYISSFVAHKDIAPTKEWLNEIELALSTADALLALLHPGFKESDWTDQEVGFAFGRGLLVISVRFGQDPYGFLARAQAVQGASKDIATLAYELFSIIRQHKQTSGAMAEALVHGFEGSSSFAEAKRSLRLIEESDYWGSRFKERLLNAVKDNDQIVQAYGVPERVTRLIRERQK
jgi:hypothetical protein